MTHVFLNLMILVEKLAVKKCIESIFYTEMGTAISSYFFIILVQEIEEKWCNWIAILSVSIGFMANSVAIVEFSMISSECKV